MKGLLPCAFGLGILIVVCTYVPNNSSLYPSFLESIELVLESGPTGDSIVLQGDLDVHVGKDSESWRGVIGRKGLSHLNPSGVMLLNFCASHSLSISNTMISHKSVHKCTRMPLVES